ncbi:hypothetical protein [Candidatus Xianfuyuplasma coldseepsis]|uniref:Uncharacterized protein n=1 Tax=Candidatus Xianfuyuplasma coldseepsis TaxID=2782163 RepID=A0A7L7KSR3_9MOLU|nr:hypothetical protein [Xianfuyuplasma coldseepsis]QMS84818.1 hypothetical protein G4Z02_03300 [Xianfuyuplasma coldseepsis]
MNLKLPFIIYELTIIVNLIFYLLLFIEGTATVAISMFVIHVFLGHFILLKSENVQDVISLFWMYTLNIMLFSFILVMTPIFSGDDVTFYILTVVELIAVGYGVYYLKQLVTSEKQLLMDVQPKLYWIFIAVVALNALLTLI